MNVERQARTFHPRVEQGKGARRIGRNFRPRLSRTTPAVTHLGMETISLTQRQQNALWIVSQYGPVSVRDLEYHHLNGDYAACHGMLTRLESRGLVQRTYTGHHRTNGRSAYAITHEGQRAIDGYAPDEDEPQLANDSQTDPENSTTQGD